VSDCADPAPPVAGEPDLDRIAARALHMMGANAERAWSGDDAMAWEGLVEVHRRLRRQAEEALSGDEELSISMLGLMGRLTRAEQQTLRQTALAEAMGLSLSRVSRVVDLLEQRDYVERHPCPSDARATNIVLTASGADVTERAQERLFGYVQGAFFDQLEPGEVTTLATIFTRLIRASAADQS
jgi:DNA-binding MarR family transcriptional regulator